MVFFGLRSYEVVSFPFFDISLFGFSFFFFLVDERKEISELVDKERESRRMYRRKRNYKARQGRVCCAAQDPLII